MMLNGIVPYMMNSYPLHIEQYEVSQELFSILSNIFLNADFVMYISYQKQ